MPDGIKINANQGIVISTIPDEQAQNDALAAEELFGPDPARKGDGILDQDEAPSIHEEIVLRYGRSGGSTDPVTPAGESERPTTPAEVATPEVTTSEDTGTREPLPTTTQPAVLQPTVAALKPVEDDSARRRGIVGQFAEGAFLGSFASRAARKAARPPEQTLTQSLRGAVQKTAQSIVDAAQKRAQPVAVLGTAAQPVEAGQQAAQVVREADDKVAQSAKEAGKKAAQSAKGVGKKAAQSAKGAGKQAAHSVKGAGKQAAQSVSATAAKQAVQSTNAAAAQQAAHAVESAGATATKSVVAQSVKGATLGKIAAAGLRGAVPIALTISAVQNGYHWLKGEQSDGELAKNMTKDAVAAGVAGVVVAGVGFASGGLGFFASTAVGGTTFAATRWALDKIWK